MLNLKTATTAMIFAIMAFSCNSRKDPNNGVLEEFYPNGLIKSETPIKNGLRNGLVKNYSENGKLLSTAEYTDDLRNGWIINYSTENGKPMLKAMLKNDIQNGPVIQYYKEGMLFRESNYVNGRIDGKVITYWPDGKIKAENFYKMGKPAIGLKEYDKDGKLIVEQPKILISQIDQLEIFNKVVLRIALSENVDELEFYLEEPFEKIYIPDHPYKLRVVDGVATIDYPAPSGSTFRKKISIMAKFRSKNGNTMVLQQYYNLAFTNKY
jgi:hypothetical protein